MCGFLLSEIHGGEFTDSFYLLNLVKKRGIPWITEGKGHLLFLEVLQSFQEDEDEHQERSEPCQREFLV